MATNIIMPALEMAQESGLLVNWLKKENEMVTKGEPLMVIETDKVTIEIEAPASGILKGILVHEGEAVPVGQTIAWLLEPGEKLPSGLPLNAPGARSAGGSIPAAVNPGQAAARLPIPAVPGSALLEVSPLARKIAKEHAVDLTLVKHEGNRIEKTDVMAYIQALKEPASPTYSAPGQALASPKARRLAVERGFDLKSIRGSGPEGAVLANDLPEAAEPVQPSLLGEMEPIGTVWRLMAERMTASWTTAPHFFLVREVDASDLIEWRKRVTPAVEKRTGIKPTYTDLLIRAVGAALRDHPRLNSAWVNGEILRNGEVNVGIATALDDGLIVPVIHNVDTASLGEITRQRHDLIERAKNHKLRPADIAGGTFTLSNLGMYNVDSFIAIVNPPQAAILASGRIAERVVPRNGEVVIRPMMLFTLSCDHRVVDGARGAKFLDDLANLIENPWGLLA